MMRALLMVWPAPVLLFWSWYVLSFNDISFGTMWFSRDLHDQVMSVYGDMLGVDSGAIPALIGKALALDGLVVLAIVAYRKRKKIAVAIKDRWPSKVHPTAVSSSPDAASRSCESLSSAP